MATSDDRPGTGRTAGSDLQGRRGTWMSDGSGGAKGSGSGGKDRGASRTPVRSGASRGSASGGSANGAPATRPAGSGGSGSGGRAPRRIRLTLARLDPFSVMKLSFLIAIAIGIATVVCVAVLWNLINAMGVWDTVDQLGKDLNNGKPMPFMAFFGFSKMLSYATIVSIINVVIITALGTLFAFLYNIVAGLLGGLRMTFTDE